MSKRNEDLRNGGEFMVETFPYPRQVLGSNLATQVHQQPYLSSSVALSGDADLFSPVKSFRRHESNKSLHKEGPTITGRALVSNSNGRNVKDFPAESKSSSLNSVEKHSSSRNPGTLKSADFSRKPFVSSNGRQPNITNASASESTISYPSSSSLMSSMTTSSIADLSFSTCNLETSGKFTSTNSTNTISSSLLPLSSIETLDGTTFSSSPFQLSSHLLEHIDPSGRPSTFAKSSSSNGIRAESTCLPIQITSSSRRGFDETSKTYNNLVKDGSSDSLKKPIATRMASVTSSSAHVMSSLSSTPSDTTMENSSVCAKESPEYELLLNTLADSLLTIRMSLHEDIQNLHLEILRQFHMQQNEIYAWMENHSRGQQKLFEEIATLREENRRLRRLL